MPQNPFDVNVQTSVRTLASMMKLPSNQFEYFLDTQNFLTRNRTFEKQVLFLLEQELLYAQNIRSNFIVNPAAILGTIPFSGTHIPTTLDNTMLPGTDAVNIDNLGGKTARVLGAKQGWNIGQLEADFEQSASPIDQVRNSVKNVVYQLLGVSTESSDASTKRGKSIEDYLSVNDNIAKPIIFQSDIAARNNYLNVNSTTADETSKQNLVNGLQFPFYLKSLNYNENSGKLYMFFQGIIDSLTESFAPNWNSEEVFGRPHPLWIYSNVNRSIGINFTIISKNFDDLDKVRQRADWLSKHTYPTMSTAQGNVVSFKSGPLISMTIGNLFQDLNGFISSLEFDWNALQRWELTKNNVFPQGLKVNMRFNVLEKKLIRNSDSDTFSIYEPFDNSILSRALNPTALQVTNVNQLVNQTGPPSALARPVLTRIPGINQWLFLDI